MINEVEFREKYSNWSKMGYSDKPEYAFIGRSNVGKSSLINLVIQRKNLAEISSGPGKTRTIDLFLVNRRWNLVDLPGYGYAKASKKSRKEWLGLMEGYFLNRRNLVNTFVLIDASIPAKDIDIQFCDWLGEHQIPFSLVFTKIDKKKQKEIEQNIQEFKNILEENWDEFPPEFRTSVKDKKGREEVLEYINTINEELLKNH